MLYGGREVKKNKYEIGDIVQVKDLHSYKGKVGHMHYRHEEGAQTGWFYKVHGQDGQYLTWSEKSLKKVQVKKTK